MNIGEIVDYINNGRASVSLAVEHFNLSVGSETLRRYIRKAGYTYDSDAKLWIVGNDGINSSRVITDIPLSPKKVFPFDDDEIEILHQIIKEYAKVDVDETNRKAVSELYERISEMTEKQTQRKTMVITKSAATALDEFASSHRLNKGDIVSLAILDFIKKYDNL